MSRPLISGPLLFILIICGELFAQTPRTDNAAAAPKAEKGVVILRGKVLAHQDAVSFSSRQVSIPDLPADVIFRRGVDFDFDGVDELVFRSDDSSGRFAVFVGSAGLRVERRPVGEKLPKGRATGPLPPEQMAEADVDGDGVNEYLKRGASGYEFYVYRMTDEVWDHGAPFVEFTPLFRESPAFIGDFNGDSLADVLVTGEPVWGDWVAMSGGEFGLKKAVQGLPKKSLMLARPADLNGDGATDIVSPDGEAGQFSLYLSELGAGIAGVEIEMQDGLTVRTGSDGSFTVTVPANRKISLSPRSEGYSFWPKTRIIETKQHSPARINFFASKGISARPIEEHATLRGRVLVRQSEVGFTRRDVFVSGITSGMRLLRTADADYDGIDDLVFREGDRLDHQIAFIGDEAAVRLEHWPADKPIAPSNVFGPIAINEGGTGDVNGDGIREAIWRGHTGVQFFAQSIPPKSAIIFPVFAEFWDIFADSPAFTGDFNGDSLVDVLVTSASPWGSWVALSDSGTGIERPVYGLPKKSFAGARPGDFNGDGATDLIVPEEDPGSFIIYLAALGNGLAGAELKLQNGATVKTGADGYFAVSVPADGEKVAIIPHAEQYRFWPERKVIVPNQFSRAPINFLASKISPDEYKGQAFGLRSDNKGPFLCLGYFAVPEWGIKWGRTITGCPSGFALLETDDAGSGPVWYPNGLCCKLPNEDMLTDEHQFVPTTCPENFVATGAKMGDALNGYLRCTRINTKRYQLGKATPGRYWGFGLSVYSDSDTLDKSELPAALRFGAGRASYGNWDTDGCVALPWGSVLVTRGRGPCKKNTFRAFQYSGLPEDPPRGTPVVIFPDCTKVENVYDPASGCK